MEKHIAAEEVFDREFLSVRAKLIDIGAVLDRIARAEGARAEGTASDDPRMMQIRESLVILAGESPDRAQRLQQVFSLDYQDNWRAQFKL